MYNSYLRMAGDCINQAGDNSLSYAGYNVTQLEAAIEYLSKAKDEMKVKKEEFLREMEV